MDLNSPPVRAQASTRVKGVGRPRLGLGRIFGQLEVSTAAAERAAADRGGDRGAPLPPRRRRRVPRRRLTAARCCAPVVARIGDERWLAAPPARRGCRDAAREDAFEEGRRRGVGSRPYLRNKNVQWGRIDTDDLLAMDFNEREIVEVQPPSRRRPRLRRRRSRPRCRLARTDRGLLLPEGASPCAVQRRACSRLADVRKAVVFDAELRQNRTNGSRTCAESQTDLSDGRLIALLRSRCRRSKDQASRVVPDRLERAAARRSECLAGVR